MSKSLLMDERELGELDVGMDDPQLRAMQGTEAASPEEEQALQKALGIIAEHLYSEEGMAKVMRVIDREDQELYETVPQIAEAFIKKAMQEMRRGEEEIPSSIYFGEGGLLQMVPVMLFEMAEQMGRPGAEDPDQLSAAVMNMHKIAGEHILKGGEESAQREARLLGEETVLTNDEGELEDTEVFAKKVNKSGKEDLQASIKQGLLGV